MYKTIRFINRSIYMYTIRPVSYIIDLLTSNVRVFQEGTISLV